MKKVIILTGITIMLSGCFGQDIKTPQTVCQSSKGGSGDSSTPPESQALLGLIINADATPLLSTTNTIPIKRSIEKTKNLEKPNKEQLKKAIFEELKRLTKNKTHTPFDIKTLVGIEKVNKTTPVTTLKHNEKGKYFSAPILISAIGIFKSYGFIDKKKAEFGEIEYLEEFETIRQFKLKMNDYGDWWAEIDNINGLDV